GGYPTTSCLFPRFARPRTENHHSARSQNGTTGTPACWISATAIPEPTHSAVVPVPVAARATAGYAMTPSCSNACGAARIDHVEESIARVVNIRERRNTATAAIA